MNKAHGAMVTCSVLATSCDPNALVSPTPAWTEQGVREDHHPAGQRGGVEALASRVSSVPGSVVPRLGSAFWSMSTPVMLILDDVHLLRNAECRDALLVLADHVPQGSRLVLAGRDEPPLRIARLRAEGRILEIGPGDLSLNREDATALLSDAGLTLAEDEKAELHRRTEGWGPACGDLARCTCGKEARWGPRRSHSAASLLAAQVGRPAEAEARGGAVDRG